MASEKIQVEYEAKIDKLQSDLKRLNEVQKKIGTQAKRTGKILETETQKTRRVVAELKKDLQFQIKLRNQAFSPKQVKKFNAEILTTQKRIIALTLGTQKLGRETRKVNKSLNFFQKTLKNVGKSLLIAFSVGAVIAFGKASAKAFDEQEKAVARLRVALGGQEDTLKSLTKQAKELQSITIFSDQDVISAQALIAAFTDEEAIIKELTRVTLDFATAKGFDLPAAAELVSKTFASSTNSLTRYGIQVQGAAGSTKRLESITKNLDAAFKGQAEAAVVGAGNLQQLSNQFGDFQEIIGGAIIKNNFFIEGLTDILETVNFLLSPTRELGEEFEKLIPFTEAELKAFEKGIKIADERNELLKLGVIISEEEQKLIEERVDAQIFLEELAAKEAESNIVRLNNIFELKAAIKKLRDEQDAEGTTRQRIFEITELLIPLEEDLLILRGKQTKAAKELAKAQDELRKANKKFREQVFKDIESAEQRIEDLQIENIESEFVRDIRRIEKNRERALEDVENTLATEEQKRIELELINEKFDRIAIERNKKNADDRNKIRQEELEEAERLAQQADDNNEKLAQDSLTTFRALQNAQTNLRIAALEKQNLSDEEFERKRKEILIESARQQKALALFSIAVATKKAITEALATPPAPNIPLGILAGILGAAEAAAVATFPLPQLAEGEIDIKGGKKGKDSIPALLMPGESVIKTKGTERYKDELTAANNLELESLIENKYVLPAIKKIRGDEAFMKRWIAENAFDDTSLLRQMKKPVSIKNVDELSSAIAKKQSRYNYFKL